MCSGLGRQSWEQEGWRPCLPGALVPGEGTDDKQAQISRRQIKQDESSGARGSLVHGVVDDLAMKVMGEAEI